MKKYLENYKLDKPMYGIDVSMWQGEIDFEKAKKEGVEFVLIKANEAKFIDPMFERNYNAAKKAGLKVGSYMYLTAINSIQAIEQAEFFNNVICNKEFEMPLFVDYEEGLFFPGEGKTENTAILKAALYYLNTICQHVCGIYTYSYYLKNYLDYDMIKSVILWCGEIAEKLPSPEYDIWQFGGDKNLIKSPNVANVVCDQNYCYYDFPAYIKDRKEGKNINFPGNDNSPSDWASDAVKWAIETGLIKGDEDGLRLRDNITREEMLTILKRYYDLKGD